MQKNELNFIQNQIDYVFKNTNLLIQAFTRRSYAIENEAADNEVLEFIGDKVLDLVVVKYLTEHYKTDSNNDTFECSLDEGELTQLKARLVQKNMLAKRMDYLGFSEFLRMGKGDTLNHVETTASVREDLFEAILGAVALDSDWDMAKLEHVVMHMLDPETELDADDLENYVGLVQDWALEMHGKLPLYHESRFSYAYGFHGNYIRGENWYSYNGREPKYMCVVKLPGHDQLFFDVGESEKQARYWAAKTAYHFLQDNKLLKTIRDEIEDPNFDDSINQLEILSRRGYFSLPTFTFSETYDADGNPVWDCQCEIEERKESTRGTSSSKKTAKKQAAFKMLQDVLAEV